MGGGSRPKQFLELGGRPIIDYTVAHFAHHPLITDITIVCLASWMDYLRDFLKTRHYHTPIDIVSGGNTGQESIFNGLSHTYAKHSEDRDAIVLIHDGVRPLIDEKTISACIQSVEQRGSTATIAPATETIVILNGTDAVNQVIPRSSVGLARAPQAFRLAELFDAHLQAQQEGLGEFIDSVSLMTHYGHRIYTVEGPSENIKVTTPMDYYAFKGYMEARDQKMLWSDHS